MSECEYPGCGRKNHARGMCGAHYQQWLSGQDLRPLGKVGRPRKCDQPGWTPPTGLSEAWRQEATRKATRRIRRAAVATEPESCALEACGGWAQEGSDLCPAHHCYREAQQRWTERVASR